MAVDLKCDGSGGGEHATKLKNETSCIVGKRSANVKCSHAVGKDAAQLRTSFPVGHCPGVQLSA